MNLNLFFDQFQGWPFQDHPPLNTITSRSSSHPMSPQPSSSQYCAMALSHPSFVCYGHLHNYIPPSESPFCQYTSHKLSSAAATTLTSRTVLLWQPEPASQHSHPVGRVVMCLGVEHGWMWWILSTKGDGKIHSTKLTFGYLWECSFHFHFPGWHGVGRWCPECAPCQPRMNEGGEEICVETIVWTDPFADDRCRPSSSSMGCLGWNISEIIEWKYLNRCSFHSSTLHA